MPRTEHLGELEQLVLLAVLRLGDDAYAVSIREELVETAQRRVTRGALYRTLERLEGKGYLAWRLEEAGPSRGGHARRGFDVTPAGLGALRNARRVLLDLWSGLEGVLR